MDDDDFANDLSEPYDSTGSYDEFDADWMAQSAAPARAAPVLGAKALIALLVGALIIGGGIGAFYLLRGTQASPQATARQFYEALNRRDFETAVSFIAPSNNISAAAFENSDALINVVVELLTGTLLEEFGIEVPDFVLDLIGDIEWEFREMNYTLVATTGDRATVRAEGQLYLAAMGLEYPAPWSITHELVRVDGKWYIDLGL